RRRRDRGADERMNRFAHLLDRLAFEHARNAKLRLMREYFRTVPDPERGWALAALTGSLSFAHAKPGLIRALIMERIDPVLVGWSYDYVGDLSETVALLWPLPPPPIGERAGVKGLGSIVRPPPPHPAIREQARASPTSPLRGEVTHPHAPS